MTASPPDDEEYKEPEPKCSIRLLIWPDRITKTLGLTPDSSVMVGQERRTPVGTLLPGRHKETRWSYSTGVHRARLYFRGVTKLIDRLEPHKDFFVEIDEGGGFTAIIVGLDGAVHTGDHLRWRDTARLSAMRMELGVEVYPNFN